MTDQPTTDPTHGLSVQHADALWDAVAIPGPTEPTFPMQHERVCRAVAEIIAELTPAPPAVPVSSPPPDQTAVRGLVEAAIKASPFHELRTVDHAQNGPLQITVRVDELADVLVRRLAAAPPPANRAAVYREVADRLTTDAHGMQPDWARIYKRDAAVKVREWAEQLDGEGRQPDVCDTCDTERCETCHGCRCNKGDDNTCGHPDCPATRVKHSGPDTKFCVLCLSGEHERVGEEA